MSKCKFNGCNKRATFLPSIKSKTEKGVIN